MFKTFNRKVKKHGMEWAVLDSTPYDINRMLVRLFQGVPLDFDMEAFCIEVNKVINKTKTRSN